MAGIAWSAVAGGAAFGFAARDLLGLARPAVALAWIAGAGVALALARWRPWDPPV